MCGLNYTAHPDRASLRDLILPDGGRPQLSPSAIALSPDGKRLYLACETASEVGIYDIAGREIVRRIEVPAEPNGLALSEDGATLYVTCGTAKGWVCFVNTSTGKISARIRSGHTATAPVLSPDGRFLYVCDRFNNAIQVLDLATRKELDRIQVDREPVAAALTPDGKRLFVANHIHSGRSDAEVVTATVSVINTAERKLIRNVPLSNGSTLLRGIGVSPDGKYVGVTHLLAPSHSSAAQTTAARAGRNALSLIDANGLTLLGTVLLDDKDRGAANPWAVQWSEDGKLLYVTHAGTHELSIIDAPGLVTKVTHGRALQATTNHGEDPAPASGLAGRGTDFEYLADLRRRVKLHGKGPRCLAVRGRRVFVANYFSDSLSLLDLSCSWQTSATISLQQPCESSPSRRGEMYFNDGTLSFDGRQSCASCHSCDARVDGMNWNLLPDGKAGTREVKSLLYCFQAQPVGTRSDAAMAVRASLQTILGSSPREEVASSIDEFLKNLQPSPSPFLVHNLPSASAERGRKTFSSAKAGCTQCHPPPLFTDLKAHPARLGNLGLGAEEFHTPTLYELWRTAPYLHDGSAGTLSEALLKHAADVRPNAAPLSSEQIAEIVSFLQSL